ncbi:MAG TPA: hypothetical protein DCR04_00225 [Flavobacteriales bacterium]|nr:hypothetical protein [Flavobacteriales bacterium]
MKKSIMIIALALLGTAAFAQNAKSDVSHKQSDTKNLKSAKLKDKLQTNEVKETKSAAEYQSTVAKKKLKMKKTTVTSDVLLKTKQEEK